MERAVLRTPIGGIGVTVSDDAVSRVTFGAEVTEPGSAPDAVGPILEQALRQLVEYFAGDRLSFDVPVRVTRGSDFERRVWAAIAAIPYGETRGYGEIARAVGEPGGAQAVGLACNRNPVPIIVPCHRVIGANGKLVGFGGGLDRKRWLLSREALVYLSSSQSG